MTYVYILRSLAVPGKTYVGMTNGLRRRLTDHNAGRSLYTSQFVPWALVYSEVFESERDASMRERQIKRWSRVKKEALIAGDTETLRLFSRRRQ